METIPDLLKHYKLKGDLYLESKWSILCLNWHNKSTLSGVRLSSIAAAVVQSCSVFATPQTAERQASLSPTISTTNHHACATSIEFLNTYAGETVKYNLKEGSKKQLKHYGNRRQWKKILYPFSVPVQNMSFLEKEILFYPAFSEVPLLQEKKYWFGLQHLVSEGQKV